MGDEKKEVDVGKGEWTVTTLSLAPAETIPLHESARDLWVYHER